MNDIDWINIGQKAAMVVIILLITWLVATIVSWAIGKLVERVSFLNRGGADGASTGASLGRIGSLVVWLFGLVAVLQVFALTSVLSPIQGMLDTILAYLPNIIGAGVVFFIGFLVARVVKQLIETSVGMVDFGGLAAKVKNIDPTAPAAGAHGAGAPEAGATRTQPSVDGRQIGSIVGNLVFAIILIVVAIASLQILGISAISDPTEQMLTLILNAIPAIIAALLILGIGYLISKLVGSLLESTLEGLGTDRAVVQLGVLSEGKSASAIITRVVQVAIMVFFAIMAARALDFPEITNLLNEVLSLGGRVVFGGVIIAAGFLVAKLLANAIGSSTASTIVRYATITLFVAMGLKYMGIADSIITLAFGAVVVGGALAAVLAFGLGGRDAAARTLEKLQHKQEVTSKQRD